MIIDEKKVASTALSDERELHIPDDAPPDYNQVVSSAPVTPADASGVSSHRLASLRQTTSTPAHVQNAVAGPSRLSPSNTASPSTPSSSWFSFTRSSKASSEIRSTVQSLIAELVRAPYADASPGILDSCASACKDAGLSVSEMLQQPNLEGHTALYWAIVKFAGRIGSADAAPEGARTLVLALLAHTTPLTQATLSEIRGAYAAVSDNALYQLCRPYLTPIQGTDRMLLTANDPESNDGKALKPEEVVVEESTEAPNAFSATFEIRMFQKRIRVGGYVSCEFVARGRIFVLTFEIVGHDASRRRRRRDRHSAAPGAWLASVSLLEHSPPTPFDSRLIIEDQTPQAPALKPKLRPPIDLRIKSDYDPLSPPGYGGRSYGNDVWAKLEDSPVAASLQSDGSPYLTSSGALRGRLEARLAKPDTDCVIC